MSSSRTFSLKEQSAKKVKIKNEDKYYWVGIDPQKIKIACYERDFNLYSTDGVGVNLHYQEDIKIPENTLLGFKHEKQNAQLKRGLFHDYLEIIAIEGKNIEPTLTVNLCFNNRFYFGWLPFLAVLAGCVSSFIWKKIRQGKKADTLEFKI